MNDESNPSIPSATAAEIPPSSPSGTTLAQATDRHSEVWKDVGNEEFKPPSKEAMDRMGKFFVLLTAGLYGFCLVWLITQWNNQADAPSASEQMTKCDGKLCVEDISHGGYVGVAAVLHKLSIKSGNPTCTTDDGTHSCFSQYQGTVTPLNDIVGIVKYNAGFASFVDEQGVTQTCQDVAQSPSQRGQKCRSQCADWDGSKCPSTKTNTVCVVDLAYMGDSAEGEWFTQTSAQCSGTDDDPCKKCDSKAPATWGKITGLNENA